MLQQTHSHSQDNFNITLHTSKYGSYYGLQNTQNLKQNTINFIRKIPIGISIRKKQLKDSPITTNTFWWSKFYLFTNWYTSELSSKTILTFWRRNYFFNFSTHCIQNVNNTGTKYIRNMKQTAFWRGKKQKVYIMLKKYSVPIFVE